MPNFLNVDNRAALDSLARLEEQDVELILFGHGDSLRDGTQSAVEAARAAERS